VAATCYVVMGFNIIKQKGIVLFNKNMLHGGGFIYPLETQCSVRACTACTARAVRSGQFHKARR